MAEKGDETRKRIVLAAIECIERQGIVNVTIRTIAAEAAVNVAAINYHFGSKEALVEVALDHALGNFFEDLDALHDMATESVRDGLRSLYTYLLEGVTRYPGITRAQLTGPFLDGLYDRRFVLEFMKFLNGFCERLSSAHGVDQRELRLIVEQGVSAILFRGMLPGLFTGFHSDEGPAQPGQPAYVEGLVRSWRGPE